MLLGPCDLTSLIKNGKINSNNKKAGGLLIPQCFRADMVY